MACPPPSAPFYGEQRHCARGHWRPAEDAKLKELVSKLGPQNWNLIAEKLEGRSGKEAFQTLGFSFGLFLFDLRYSFCVYMYVCLFLKGRVAG